MTSSLNDVWSALASANPQLADVLDKVESRTEEVFAQIQEQVQERTDTLHTLLSESINLGDVQDALGQVVSALENLHTVATTQASEVASDLHVTWDSLFSEKLGAVGESLTTLHDTVHSDVASFVDALDGHAPTPAEVKALVGDLGDAFHTFLTSLRDSLHTDTLV
ncbi:hypothetical protein V5F49_21270 [Xanthobacter sp. V3C-3]|uniref:hypothetical protein n=1 Tax=Xanthobacter lutulentifluminis TaxID=3119935 RepID=UPI00372B858F